MDKELKARLQHAVIGEGSTTTSSIPKKGEIIFNDTLDNLKVGNGNTTYSQLNNFIKTIAAAAGSDIGDVGTPSVTTSTSGDTTTFTFHQLKGEQGDQGDQGDPGPQGTSIDHIRRTSGSGAAGTIDTYTVYSSVEESASTILGTFNVYNGSDGNGISVKPSASDCTEIGDAYIEQDSTSAYYGHIMILTSTSPRTFTDGGNVQGPTGRGISSVAWTSNSGGQPQGTAGTTDTYTITYTTGTPATSTFIVYNGENGDRGSKWFTGSGVPSTVGDSEIGDYYLNSSDGGVWEKTGEAAWTYRTNIMGASGADGATWHSGTAVTSITSNVPSGVVVGDYYLNTNTYNVYKCISTTDSTKWSLECNIKGSQGNPGSNGNSVFISYSENADGNPNHSTFTTGDKYIGIYVGQSAPSSYTGYSWAKFVGEDGTSVTVNDTAVRIYAANVTGPIGTFTLNQVPPQSGYIDLCIPTFNYDGHNYGLVPVIPTENIGTLSSNSKQVLSEEGWKKIPTFGSSSTWGLVTYTGSSSNLVLKSDGSWGSFSYSLDASFYSSLPQGWSTSSMSTGEYQLQTSKLNLIAGNNVTFNLVKEPNSTDIAGIKINATGSSYTLPTATSGVLGGLIVHEDAPEQVALYIDTSNEHKCVPIYYAESTVDPVNGVDIGERHYVNLYDIAEALEHNTELRERFQSVLNMK